MIHYYTGVGSRRTLRNILALMVKLADRFREIGWILRSGGAPGADQAFQIGCGEEADIYLPWPGFERDFQLKYPVQFLSPGPSTAAMEMARSVHPAWHKLTKQSQMLHGRNCHQVMGQTLCNPSTLVVCWTQDGAETVAECGYETGGTGTAIRVACRYKIPVFNLAREGALQRLGDFVKSVENADNGTRDRVVYNH